MGVRKRVNAEANLLCLKRLDVDERKGSSIYLDEVVVVVVVNEERKVAKQWVEQVE
jgi:hypothetical protein